MSDPDELCCLSHTINPDIAGIGVRAALYAQIMLGWVVSMFYPDTYAKNSRTAYMTATALIIAAFIQLQTQLLSLVDGLVVSLITSMMVALAITSNPAPNQRQPQASSPNSKPEEDKHSVDSQKSATGSFMQFCFIVFWAAWSLNLWKDPAHFGVKGENIGCQTINYGVILPVFNREINATDPRMRNAALALISIGFFTALGSMWLSLDQIMKLIIWLTARGKDQNAQIRKPTYEHPYIKCAHIFLQYTGTATPIYLIVFTERIISRNDFDGTSRYWSFGQTLSLILLLQQVMDIFSTFRKNREELEDRSELDHTSMDLEMPDLRASSTTLTLDPVAAPVTSAATTQAPACPRL